MNEQMRAICSVGTEFYFATVAVDIEDKGELNILLLHKERTDDEWQVISSTEVAFEKREVVGATTDYKLTNGIYKCVAICKKENGEFVFAESRQTEINL